MALLSNKYHNETASKYINFVMQDVAPKKFEIIFGENEIKQEELLKKWNEYVKSKNIEQIVYVATDNVLKVSNGTLIIHEKNNSFSVVDGTTFSPKKISGRYGIYKGYEFTINMYGNDIDLKDNLWVYFARQNPDVAPLVDGFTHSYFDSWKKTAAILEDLRAKTPYEALKSNTLIFKIPRILDKRKNRAGEDVVQKDCTGIYNSIKGGLPVMVDTTVDIEQLSYDGHLMANVIKELWRELSIYTSIPASQLEGMTVGGLNTTGAANNDSKNYIKLITKIQQIVETIWLYFIKKFLFEIGDELGSNIHEVKIIPPAVHETPIEQQLIILEKIRTAIEQSPIESDDLKVAYDHLNKKLIKSLK